MEKWKPLRASHFSTPPTATDLLTHPLRYTNNLAGSKHRARHLTLEGIPTKAFDYVLGTRSALEWIVDQYRYEEDSAGNVLSDPNDPNDDEYIVHLIERVTTVSIDTLALIVELPLEIEFTGLGTGEARRSFIAGT